MEKKDYANKIFVQMKPDHSKRKKKKKVQSPGEAEH